MYNELDNLKAAVEALQAPYRKPRDDMAVANLLATARAVVAAEASAAAELEAVKAQLAESIERERRAQLLTPETVKAICERAGFKRDSRWWVSANGLAVEKRHGWNVWDFYRTTSDWRFIAVSQTVGQFEDAIKAAKGDA
jgi:hypothetical protein